MEECYFSLDSVYVGILPDQFLSMGLHSFFLGLLALPFSCMEQHEWLCWVEALVLGTFGDALRENYFVSFWFANMSYDVSIPLIISC